MSGKIRYIPDAHKLEEESHIITFVRNDLQSIFKERVIMEKNMGRAGVQVSELKVTDEVRRKASREPLYYDKAGNHLINSHDIFTV